MNSEMSRLSELIELAKEPSSEKRRALLREITDQFFASSSKTEAESQLYDAVLTQLSSEMEEAIRVELSNRMSTAADAPRKLTRRLALDVAQVAEPVLRKSEILTEDDLLEVARTRGQGHLRAISQRAQVSEIVSEEIVKRGDDETLDKLVRNNGAKLSRFASETVVDRAQQNPKLHEAVVNREALPVDLLNEMYFVVKQQLRQRILEQNACLNKEMVEAAIQAGSKRVATADNVLPPDFEEAQKEIKAIQAKGGIQPEMLVRFLRSGEKTKFLIAVANLAKIDYATAQLILTKTQIDALAVVCRAANLERALFVTFAVLLLDKQDDAMAKAQTYGQMYVELPQETAQRTLRFWRMRRQTVTDAAA